VAELGALLRPMLSLWEERQAQQGSADAVYATLREAILSRVLHPGQPFAEEDLANAFGVSRTPIREAILRLEAERLLERRGKRRLSVTAISPEEILEIYDVRVVLDGLAAGLAASKSTPPEISQLRWLNDQLAERGQHSDFAAMTMLNLEFHEALAKAGRNWFLHNQLQGIQDWVRRFERSTFEFPDRWKGVIAEHDAIILAIEARDTAGAEQAAKTHMLTSKQVRLEMVAASASTEQAAPAG
jgi:DNA-binding GntR family transcriptional regulator